MADTYKRLRIMSYMTPGYPVALYQTYQYYLEEILRCDSYLMLESRQSGPLKDKNDPFSLDDVDIGFMCSTAYLKCEQEGNKYIELLPVAPIYIHKKSELKPVYFSEVIINTDKKKKITTFADMKGHKWAYNDESSLSGSISTLSELKKLGYNASFFGNVLHSGSHHNSIQMVINNTVDGAAIDSNVLQYFLKEHPEYRNQIDVLCSWGPLPAPPVVINSRMPVEMKNKITQALLNMNKSEKWQKELSKFDVWGFKSIDRSLFDVEQEIKDIVKGASVHAVYY